MHDGNRKDDFKDLQLAPQNILFWLIDGYQCNKYVYGVPNFMYRV